MTTTTKTTTRKPATRKAAPAKAAPAKAAQAAPAPAKAPQAPQAPQAPLHLYKPYTASNGSVPAYGWPAKAASGNSIRAYCASVAQALNTTHPDGWTVAQFASALAAQAAGSSYKQPGGGWGTEKQPNGVARQHANWFCAPAQQWCPSVAWLAEQQS